jgi:hypothetical protein
VGGRACVGAGVLLQLNISYSNNVYLILVAKYSTYYSPLVEIGSHIGYSSEKKAWLHLSGFVDEDASVHVEKSNR